MKTVRHIFLKTLQFFILSDFVSSSSISNLNSEKALNCSYLFTSENHLDLSYGHYVKSLSRRIPTYDHVTCFVMKSRYNCAHNYTVPGLSPLDWEYRLKNKVFEGFCSLEGMFNSNGGLEQLAQHIRLRSRRPNDSEERNVTTNVFIAGNSFLRQLWEVLACTYRTRIIGGFLSADGPKMDITSYNNQITYTAEQSGRLISLLEEEFRGCHTGNIDHFFEENVTHPPNDVSCSDNIAMVEFQKNLRFYYVFRHWVYDHDLDALFTKIGLNYSEVDALITNNNDRENRVLRSKLRPTTIYLRLHSLLPYFANRQKRDIGRFFSANNIGVAAGIDEHPCMPGVPDDELFVMLLLLSYGLSDIKYS